jgi:DNA-binding transcriptional regulator YhcF (GntR family)
MKIEIYRQIARTLVNEIESGIYPVGADMPSRLELSRRFGVTRATVNRAMEQLELNGLISARRGAGTVVVNSGMRRRIALVAPEWLIQQLPGSDACRVLPVGYAEALGSRSSIAALARFDGILWSHPEDSLIPRIAEIMESIPGALINRVADGCNYVTSELKESFEQAVRSRLEQAPGATAYLLKNRDGSKFVHHSRDEGFVAACRTLRRFYEVIEMPADFADKRRKLDAVLPAVPAGPLYIFADDWSETGALIQWVWQHKLQWRRDVFYLDTDNIIHRHVWGLETASIIQDFYGMTQTALELLLKSLRNPGGKPFQVLVKPVLRQGDT